MNRTHFFKFGALIAFVVVLALLPSCDSRGNNEVEAASGEDAPKIEAIERLPLVDGPFLRHMVQQSWSGAYGDATATLTGDIVDARGAPRRLLVLTLRLHGNPNGVVMGAKYFEAGHAIIQEFGYSDGTQITLAPSEGLLWEDVAKPADIQLVSGAEFIYQ